LAKASISKWHPPRSASGKGLSIDISNFSCSVDKENSFV